MKPESGKTVSVWMETADVPQFEPLDDDAYTEVCIIGGGIAGLTTAYLLAKEGCDVIVVDDNDIAGGETQRTTAHLSNVLDDHYYSLLSERGRDVAKHALEAHTAAIDLIERNCLEENIDCNFSRLDGYLFADVDQSVKDLKKEFKACEQIGYKNFAWTDTFSLGSRVSLQAIRFRNQAQFHVLKYLSGLAKAIRSFGGRIYTYTHVDGIKEGQPVTVNVSGPEGKHAIRASWVVAATNTPVTDFMRVSLKQAAYRTYAVAARVPVSAVEPALYWDLADPYHYIRTQPIEGSDLQWLIIGGEDHRTGQDQDGDPAQHLDVLENYAREMFPVIEKCELRWSGQVQETLDGLALIGRDPEHKANVMIATGDSGMGMTHGSIAGMLLRDMIVGAHNPWEHVFDPARWPIKSLGEVVAEGVETAKGYAQYFTRAEDVTDVAQIEPGTGAVIENAGHKIAAYRDLNGELHQNSAICPHMKGLLHWNDCEQSWDCPAHGSRFDATGQVIDGPAICNMSPIPEDAQIKEGEQEQPGGPFMPPPQGTTGIEPRH